ncbi:POZ-, AT hook-, and zinc finger-containing protein 1-like isoform X1 [Acipenser oxyrinchus oxyrinchus]|uniref:POZ-, AT hook-, and zinc finger-containing protein 1-like isoform X1 n=1 Tax=Acipenser oxyrinchus oxyrinchus TaxID=40147 RepID=A0AAD8CXV8_ACIOX|nr:POZ-, AT hook-, and zinc finger-containing protein 1-like isoform X1 [Acipenser oxyrinchus oxyrinchus]
MERISEQPWNSSYTYQVSKHSDEMLHNLNDQRKNGGRFCDVILRVGEDSFPAHKAVLAACSQYFESVFSCQAEGGGETKELEMHTISAKVFKDILDFAYTSKIVVRLECFPELMTAAKFLLMRSVIRICQEVIKQSNVQILVPPARGDLALLRTGAPDLGFPLDMSNGSGLVGSVFGTNGQAHDGDVNTQASGGLSLTDSSPSAIPPGLQAAERIPVTSPQLAVANPFQNVASGAAQVGAGGKRGRGRPKKIPAVDRMLFGGPTVPKEQGVFPCGLCGKLFTDGVRLRNHEAQHSAPSISLHSMGSSATQQPRPGENGVPIHIGVADGTRKRERTRRHVGCDICGKVFRDVYHLNRHKLSHSGEKPYACPVCGLRFKRKDRMSYHVRSHDGSVGKPYVCQTCGKGFSRPDHLNGHIKQVHTSERPHKCQVEEVKGHGSNDCNAFCVNLLKTCNASFATRDRLRSHLACHEDKIPCQVCGKFLRAAYMTDHLKKHSEGPHNYCNICNKGFSTASYLKVHVKSHHGAALPGSPHFTEQRDEPQNGGAAFHMGRTYFCASRRLLVSFPEAEVRFRGLPAPDPPTLPFCPPPIGFQPEVLLGKPGAQYFWECRAAGLPGRHADGQEDLQKCPHQDPQDSSDNSFGELSDGSDVKSHHKVEEESLSFQCEAGGGGEGDGKSKNETEKKHTCPDCGSSFRSRSHLNKHVLKAHCPQKGMQALGELAPFSPQQNMSLLESFGFQIVQSAFASSLTDPEAGHSGMNMGGK